MLDTYIKNRGMFKTIIHNKNRNTVNETNWDADYDGTVANVSLDLSKNGKNDHLDFKLTNDDLANLLTIPSVNKPLHKRIKMDFKKPESFEKIFLELNPKLSDSESESESDLDLSSLNFDSILNKNILMDGPKKVSPIQDFLTHISSPKSNEEFIMPFENNSLIDKQPVIKVVHKSFKNKKKRRSSRKSNRKSNRRKHHNYPSTRKSPTRYSIF